MKIYTMETPSKRNPIPYNDIDINSESVNYKTQIDYNEFIEYWFVDDGNGFDHQKIHRKDGPAIIITDRNENVIIIQFWLCGRFYHDFKEWLTLTPVNDSIKSELVLIYG